MHSDCIFAMGGQAALVASGFPHLRESYRPEHLDFINEILKETQKDVEDTHVSAKIKQRGGESTKGEKHKSKCVQSPRLKHVSMRFHPHGFLKGSISTS